jgi:hypothetical protein
VPAPKRAGVAVDALECFVLGPYVAEVDANPSKLATGLGARLERTGHGQRVGVVPGAGAEQPSARLAHPAVAVVGRHRSP